MVLLNLYDCCPGIMLAIAVRTRFSNKVPTLQLARFAMDFPAGSPVFRSLLVFLEALNQGSTQKPYRFRPGFGPPNFVQSFSNILKQNMKVLHMLPVY